MEEEAAEEEDSEVVQEEYDGQQVGQVHPSHMVQKPTAPATPRASTRAAINRRTK